ncbi:hypothetical protein C8R45DRAFT_580581 [Mycena sanguinolenta]|nr:hypothetical protein C8R45DRAFT_580581 [Mycena sanguinolenta]
MTVQKGLLRETRAMRHIIDTLVGCQFQLDDLEDPLTLTALRMLAKDLLRLFQAGNEGVIILLEHYFEMSHIDATEVHVSFLVFLLGFYRQLCAHRTRGRIPRRRTQAANPPQCPRPEFEACPVPLLQEYLDTPGFEDGTSSLDCKRLGCWMKTRTTCFKTEAF